MQLQGLGGGREGPAEPAESGSVFLHIPALWSHCLLHGLLCSSSTLQTYF